MADLRGTEVYTQNKQPYNQPMSIWDAYRQGRFGDINSEDENVRELARNNRNYYMLDAIANFGQKTADNIGRVAAAYGGGSYTPSDTTSLWEKRGQGLTQSGTEAEQANVKGSSSNIEAGGQGQAQTQVSTQLGASQLFEQYAKNEKNPMLKALYTLMAADTAGANISTGAYVAGPLAAFLTGKSGTNKAQEFVDNLDDPSKKRLMATFNVKDEQEIVTALDELKSLLPDATDEQMQQLLDYAQQTQAQKVVKKENKDLSDAVEFWRQNPGVPVDTILREPAFRNIDRNQLMNRRDELGF